MRGPRELEMYPEARAGAASRLCEAFTGRFSDEALSALRTIGIQLTAEIAAGVAAPDPGFKIRLALSHLKTGRDLLLQVVEDTPAPSAELPPEVDLPPEADAVEIRTVVACVLHDCLRPAIDDLLVVAGPPTVEEPAPAELAGAGRTARRG